VTHGKSAAGKPAAYQRYQQCRCELKSNNASHEVVSV
jgi:hypothetical protein